MERATTRPMWATFAGNDAYEIGSPRSKLAPTYGQERGRSQPASGVGRAKRQSRHARMHVPRKEIAQSSQPKQGSRRQMRQRMWREIRGSLELPRRCAILAGVESK